MRQPSTVFVLLLTAIGRPAAAQTPSPAPVPAAGSASGYAPLPPPESATTHPQPPDRRVWRLVDPAETDWHSLDPNRVRGWVRVDTDGHGTGGYAGGSFRIDDSLAFAPFAHVSGTVAEPNLALTWQAGPLWLMPAIGTSLDFGATRAVSIDPQLFLAVDMKLLYLEAWAQYFIASVYHTSATDTFASRLMLLFSAGSVAGIGVEYDPTIATRNGPPSSLVSSVFGGRLNLRIGDSDTLGLFVGYQTVAEARLPTEGVAGRLEYVHQW